VVYAQVLIIQKVVTRIAPVYASASWVDIQRLSESAYQVQVLCLLVGKGFVVTFVPVQLPDRLI
jgi:hypothetical protein